ncbi:hypothetical protein [Neisseria animaloris]|uniref:hypothetical protein n=1 Tax=Neisseria animaloris TaxID=326522 RepID=UPI00190047F3|nr:hypothetical protein [Neisseria animaloris]
MGIGFVGRPSENGCCRTWRPELKSSRIPTNKIFLTFRFKREKTMIEAEVVNQLNAALADLAERSTDIRGYL